MRIEIYCAYNIVTKKCYVGKTKKGVPKRISEHFKNKKTPFQLALNKYGLQAFRVGVIAVARSNGGANKHECFWIRALECKAPGGYNLTDGGDGLTGTELEIYARIAASKIGKKPKPETIAKMKASHAKRPDVRRKKRRLARRGTPEAKARRRAAKCQKLKKSAKRRWQDSDYQKFMSKVNTGAVHSPEQRAANATVHRDLWEDSDWRANQVAKRIGKQDSAETRQKKSRVSAEAWKKPERRKRGVEAMLNNTHTLGFHWINNGTENRSIPDGAEPPAGWVFGMLSTHMVGRKVITNGERERRIYPDDPLPEGWWFGRNPSVKFGPNPRSPT